MSVGLKPFSPKPAASGTVGKPGVPGGKHPSGTNPAPKNESGTGGATQAKGAALQSTTPKQPQAQPVFPKASATSTGPSRHSTNEQPAKATQTSVPPKTSAPSQARKSEGPSKSTGEKKSSGSAPATPNARRDSHTDHPVTMPPREERGGGGQGKGGQGDGFHSNHHESMEGLQNWMPVSAQLSHKTTNPRMESRHTSGMARGLAVSTKRMGFQAAFQSFLSGLVPAMFRRSPASQHAEAKSIKDHAVRKQIRENHIEQNNVDRTLRNQAIRGQSAAESRPLNGNPKFVSADQVTTTSAPASATSSAPRSPNSAAAQTASTTAASSSAAPNRGAQPTRNGSAGKSASNGPSASTPKRGVSPETIQRLSVALAA